MHIIDIAVLGIVKKIVIDLQMVQIFLTIYKEV